MATWSALDITEDMIRGVAGPDFADAAGSFDDSKVLEQVKDSAKRLVKTKIMAKIGPLVLKKGGPNAFFDAVADIADAGEELSDIVQEMLVYAFLHQWAYSEHPSAFSRLVSDAEHYMDQLLDATIAFCRVAPALILSGDELTVGETGTVSGSSSPDYYSSAL